MPEYFVSILNWPVEGENEEDAARNAYRSLKGDSTGFFLTVTKEEIYWEPRDMFDTYDFEDQQNERDQESGTT